MTKVGESWLTSKSTLFLIHLCIAVWKYNALYLNLIVFNQAPSVSQKYQTGREKQNKENITAKENVPLHWHKVSSIHHAARGKVGPKSCVE